MSARLDLAYDGAGFAGWARQPGKRTVEGELRAAFERIRGEPIDLTVAGRTDAGVHARGQVVSHPGEPIPEYSLNGVLAPDVRVLASEAAPDGFDARRDARSRTYRYRIETAKVPSPFERGRALHWPRPFDCGVLDACAAALSGRNNFTAFTKAQTEHRHFEREILRAEWIEEDYSTLAFWIEADSFLRHMVRTLVGTMLMLAADPQVGGMERFERLLSGRPREEAGDTAAAHGLYLESVTY
ncbi:MAG: tRNA pseudouridine(38-40) synthase TruA [Thermoleophilaceae bacterium]